MVLSWNEIRERAVLFSKEWENTANEEADAKPFLVEFFNVFGISRKRFASFEYRVKKLDEKDGYIDLLWKGTILIEMKSRGKNLDKAYTQAKEYLHGLRQHELPKYILISDFENFRLYDLEEDTIIEFKINELVKNVQHFGHILGYPKKIFREQDPANIKAAELMGKLHDRLKEIGYEGHPLEVYLVRVLFCLFAEDTSIFNKQQFQDYIEQRTSEDGSDLAAKLQELFQVLNTPKEKRFKNLDEQLADFAYVNGKLFDENLPMASFDSKMRRALLECCYIDWSKISPAIFGSMFQSVMNPVERRNLGAHYTSESNILKVIKPLFLDELWQEFESIKENKNKLPEFHKKLSKLHFLDPACGCGNFLIITYRELRLLEIEVLAAIQKGQQVLDIRGLILIDIDQMCGIEYEEFPARIAEVAMYLIDHQMNMLISSRFGDYFARLPLKKSPNIVHGNALQIAWESVIPKDELSFILGNPPFIGSKIMKQNQRDEVIKQFENVDGSGVLDYVTAWYIKAAKYIQDSKIKVGFVSTNSIVQGEQTAILWGQMLYKYHIKIHFAHRTFRWSNEAKGNAAVYCVIIGFANYDTDSKVIFDYEDIKGAAHEIKARNINPYLVDAKDILIEKRRTPICNVPKIVFGNMPNDGGHLLFTDEEKNEFLQKEPQAEKYIKPIISAHEFLNNEKRWCLWLVDSDPAERKKLPEVMKRMALVEKYRLASSRKATNKLANTPMLFGEIRQPSGKYILIPNTTSENRKYIPLGFFDKNDILTNSCSSVNSTATIYHFGVLTSAMHIAWVKYTCGRLKSDFRYSNEIVYNNFPWAENPDKKQIIAIEKAAQKVLDARALFPNASLADLYHPNNMPPALVKAHNELDKAVDLAYRPQPFTSEANRMVFLFELYEKYTADLFTKEKVKKKRKEK
ncbi:MAG: class I SAM-dependent DNA methyltransferase [Cytophagales bacterium]|nr:MAG: class I SAM-dependent DNA methyltransferase [Cytophagales bacterium]